MARYTRYFLLFTLSVVTSLILSESASGKKWTDATGKHTIEADFISLESGMVTLKATNGDTIQVPLEKLSNADQEFAKSSAVNGESDNPFLPSTTERSTGQVKANGTSHKYIRLSLTVSDFGDCNLNVEETSAPISSATEFDGEQVTLNRFSNEGVLKSADGRYRLIHSFDHPDPLEKLFPATRNVEMDRISETVLFKSVGSNPATATYWSRLKPPIVVCYDRLPITKTSGIIMFLRSQQFGRVGVNLMRWSNDKTPISIYWNEADNDGNLVNGSDGTIQTPILTPRDIETSKGYQYKFRLPLPNARIEDPFELQFWVWSQNPVNSEMKHLLVQGRLCPFSGIGFTQQNSVVFVNRIIPGFIADHAGLVQGDVIISINGQEPKTVADAAAVLNNISIGDELTFKIKRRDQEQQIKTTAE